MIIHSLKIAWRNLLKYKTQSVISIIGLAIGFTAFSFTLSWIRYERGYDKHIPDADRIYVLIPKDEDVSLSGPMVSTALPDYLQSRYTEIEAITLVSTSQYIAFGNEQPKDEWTRFLYDCRFTAFADTSFFSVFYPDIKINFSRWDLRMNESVILTRSIAEKWSTTENSLGMKIESLHIVPIAIIPDQSLHSNVAFRMMNIYEPDKGWNHSIQARIYVRLHRNVDGEAFAKKMDTIHIQEVDYYEDMHFEVVPIRELHYTYSEQSTNLKFTYLKYMGIIALSVIFCALINYVMLFINRIKARSR